MPSALKSRTGVPGPVNGVAIPPALFFPSAGSLQRRVFFFLKDQYTAGTACEITGLENWRRLLLLSGEFPGLAEPFLVSGCGDPFAHLSEEFRNCGYAMALH